MSDPGWARPGLSFRPELGGSEGADGHGLARACSGRHPESSQAQRRERQPRGRTPASV